MKKYIPVILIYLFGIALNLTVIKTCYKVNFAYDVDGRSFLKAESFMSFGATPAVIWVCYDSNSKWCN